MRLIDADALMESLYDELSEGEVIYRIPPSAIDNAPTVDAIPLPCKVGDEVWCVRDTRVCNKPVKGTVTEIYFRDNMDMCIVVRRLCRGRWGERVFATEQEAQVAIDRRVNDGKM